MPATILIGAGPNLGAGLARRFATGGHDLALLARDRDRLRQMAASLPGDGVKQAIGADATDLASLCEAVREAIAAVGPPHCLIYSLSRFHATRGPDLAAETLEEDLRLCATGALAATQVALPAMEGTRGAVVWTGGGTALHPEKATATPALAAGKAAMRALALASAAAFGRRGITLSTVTVDGTIAQGGAFDPDRIAERFWRIAALPPDERPVEEVYRG